MEPEDLCQYPGGLLVAGGDVHPDQPVVALQQGRKLLDRVLFDAVIGLASSCVQQRGTMRR
jgi:hypothetical protein